MADTKRMVLLLLNRLCVGFFHSGSTASNSVSPLQVQGSNTKDAVSSWELLLENSHRLRKDLPDLRKRRTSFLFRLLQLACFAALLVSCLTIDKLKGFHILGLEAWRWWGLLFAVVGGGLAVALLMDVVLFCLELWNSVLRKKVEGKDPEQLKNTEKRYPEQLKNTEEIDLEQGRAVQARSNVHKDGDCDDQHHQTPSSKNEEGLGDRKWMKLVEELLESGEKMEQVLEASKISLVFVIWAACVLSTWILLFRNEVRQPEHRSKIQSRVTAALAGVLLSAVVWMAKTMWLQVLAFSFIVERSRERIRKAQEDQMVLHTISSRVIHDFREKKRLDESNSGHLRPNTNGSTEEKALVLPVELDLISHKRHWTPKSTILKIAGITLPLLVPDDDDIGNVARVARVTAGWLFEQIVEVYGGMEDQERPPSKKSRCVMIRKDHEELIPEKLGEINPAVKSFLFMSSQKKVKLIPRILRVRRSELEEWLAKVYVNRLVLLRSINGGDDVVCDLNRILSIMVIFFDIVMFLFIMDLLTTTVAISIAAQIMALNFMFGESAKTTFKAFFFVFESQPFHVGDHCKINIDRRGKTHYEGVVHDMDLLTTIFTKPEGDKIYYPNSVLIDKSIENFYPVPDTTDIMEFFVKHQEDPESFCQVLTKNIKLYLEKNSKYWYPDINVEIEEVVNDIKTTLVVLTVKHQVDYYNRREWSIHRGQLMTEVGKILSDNGYLDSI